MFRHRLPKILLLAATFVLASCDSSLFISSSLDDTSSPTSSLTSISSSLSDTSNVSASSSATSSSSASTTSSSPSTESSTSSSSSASSSQWPDDPINDVTVLDFYNFNDFHGTVEYAPDATVAEPGINRLANYIKTKRSLNSDGFVLTSSGDMWQGSADSNITRGRLVTDAMNLMGFDAMAIGNHEFDWGTDVIRSNATLANYPFLGTNIIQKSTGQRADFAQSHTMIERAGVRIGIIGTIGPGLEGSILTSVVADYSFNPIDSYVAAAASELEQQGAHITILLNHDGDVSYGALDYVDLVFNGHAHAYDVSISNNTPIIQARSNGVAVGFAKLQYDKRTDTVTTLSYGVDDYLGNKDLSEDPDMATLYADYYEREIREIKEEIIGTATYSFSRAQIGNLTVAEMLEYGSTYGAVAAIHNTGGIRASIPSGPVTFGDVYKALPFDNDLIVFNLTGLQLKTWLSSYIYVAGVDKYNYTFDHNGQTIVNSQTYKIISISYLTEDIEDYPHDVASELNTHAFARDLVADKWRATGAINPYDYS